MTIPGDPTPTNDPVTPVLTPPATPAPTEQSGSTGSPQGVVNPIAQQSTEISALIATYNQRISGLQSAYDKMANERNTAITNWTNIQEDYSRLKAEKDTAINSSATTAQQALDHNRTLEQQMDDIRGQLNRANALLENPELAPYARFVPVSTDSEKVKTEVEQLKQIRQQDLDRLRAAQPGYAQQPAPTGNESILNLYQGRPNMAPGAFNQQPPQTQEVPGSTPSQMSPMASVMNPTDEINRILTEARQSGDPAKFQAAMARALELAPTAVNLQMGRSS